MFLNILGNNRQGENIPVSQEGGKDIQQKQGKALWCVEQLFIYFSVE